MFVWWMVRNSIGSVVRLLLEDMVNLEVMNWWKISGFMWMNFCFNYCCSSEWFLSFWRRNRFLIVCLFLMILFLWIRYECWLWSTSFFKFFSLFLRKICCCIWDLRMSFLMKLFRFILIFWIWMYWRGMNESWRCLWVNMNRVIMMSN